MRGWHTFRSFTRTFRFVTSILQVRHGPISDRQAHMFNLSRPLFNLSRPLSSLSPPLFNQSRAHFNPSRTLSGLSHPHFRSSRAYVQSFMHTFKSVTSAFQIVTRICSTCHVCIELRHLHISVFHPYISTSHVRIQIHQKQKRLPTLDSHF